ncbi:MAG: CPBP family intramembrane metalloprotease [Clostridiales bacterium]|nr:CPBP family intramembrane metalloprotease [Clostridiales bacterium]
MKKYVNYLYGLLAFFAAEGIQIIVAGVLAIVYSLVFGFSNGLEMNGLEINSNALYLISIMASLVCGAAFALWYYGTSLAGVKEERKANFLHFLTGRNILLFLGLGLGCQFFTSGVMSLIQSYFPKTFDNYSKVLELLTSGSIGLVVLYAVVIAPIVEELIFRGVILHLIGKANNVYLVIIFQALLFGIYHGNIVQGIYGTGLGILLGYTMVKFRTIAAPILLHMMINASAFLMNIIPSNMISFLMMTLIGGTFIIWGIRNIKRV